MLQLYTAPESITCQLFFHLALRLCCSHLRYVTLELRMGFQKPNTVLGRYLTVISLSQDGYMYSEVSGWLYSGVQKRTTKMSKEMEQLLQKNILQRLRLHSLEKRELRGVCVCYNWCLQNHGGGKCRICYSSFPSAEEEQLLIVQVRQSDSLGAIRQIHGQQSQDRYERQKADISIPNWMMVGAGRTREEC